MMPKYIMKFMICVNCIMMVILMVAGCAQNETEYNEMGEETVGNQTLHVQARDENYRQLKELFFVFENELERLIVYMKEKGMLYELENVAISIPTDEEIERQSFSGAARGWTRLVFYRSEIVYYLGDEEIVSLFESDYELLNLINDVSELGAFWSISIPKELLVNVWIEFSIRTSHTSFIESETEARSFFIYIEGVDEDALSRRGVVRIRDNWFMEIMERD